MEMKEKLCKKISQTCLDPDEPNGQGVEHVHHQGWNDCIIVHPQPTPIIPEPKAPRRSKHRKNLEESHDDWNQNNEDGEKTSSTKETLPFHAMSDCCGMNILGIPMAHLPQRNLRKLRFCSLLLFVQALYKYRAQGTFGYEVTATGTNWRDRPDIQNEHPQGTNAEVGIN